nr:hypothetical protein [Tanacetum cinerariifolium]
PNQVESQTRSNGCYKCQLDEQWFNLTKDTLRDALQITPVNNNNAFSSPPTPDARINFVNDLGYLKVVRNLSNVVTNDMFQSRRALTTIINLCLTGKTSGFERPRAPVLQILWGPVKATKKSKPSTSKADLWPPVTKPDSSQQPKPKPAPAKALKESLKSVYDAHRGPLPPVFIREPDSRKYQPLPEVQRKRTSTPTESSGSEKDEGQAGPNPGDVAASQPQSSHVVHDGPNLEHMDLEATDVSTKLDLEKIDKGVTATAYPNTTAETKAESMVSVTIQQDTSSIPPMTTPIIDFTLRPDSPNVHRPLQTTTTETTTTITTTTHPPPPQLQQSTTYSMLMKHISKFEQIMANLIQDNKHLEERRTSTPTESSGHDESSSLYAELGLTDSEVEFDEDVPGINAGVQDEGQARPNFSEKDEG